MTTMTAVIFLCDIVLGLFSISSSYLTQVLPVPGQVWALCPHPQGDPHRLPLHEPSQGQEEQARGHGRVVAGAQPQQLLHQLRQLGGLLGGQAQSHRPGERDVRGRARSLSSLTRPVATARPRVVGEGGRGKGGREGAGDDMAGRSVRGFLEVVIICFSRFSNFCP